MIYRIDVESKSKRPRSRDHFRVDVDTKTSRFYRSDKSFLIWLGDRENEDAFFFSFSTRSLRRDLARPRLRRGFKRRGSSHHRPHRHGCAEIGWTISFLAQLGAVRTRAILTVEGPSYSLFSLYLSRFRTLVATSSRLTSPVCTPTNLRISPSHSP